MKILAKVIAVQARSYKKDGVQKQAADVVLLSGSDVLKTTLFHDDVISGRHTKFESMKDKEGVFDVIPEVYRGNLQYRLGFEEPRLLTPSKSVTAAA